MNIKLGPDYIAYRRRETGEEVYIKNHRGYSIKRPKVTEVLHKNGDICKVDIFIETLSDGWQVPDLSALEVIISDGKQTVYKHVGVLDGAPPTKEY